MLALAFGFSYYSYTPQAAAYAGFCGFTEENFSKTHKKRASPSLGSPLELVGLATNRDALYLTNQAIIAWTRDLS
jgi:hypothetical protein